MSVGQVPNQKSYLVYRNVILKPRQHAVMWNRTTGWFTDLSCHSKFNIYIWRRAQPCFAFIKPRLTQLSLSTDPLDILMSMHCCYCFWHDRCDTFFAILIFLQLGPLPQPLSLVGSYPCPSLALALSWNKKIQVKIAKKKRQLTHFTFHNQFHQTDQSATELYLRN